MKKLAALLLVMALTISTFALVANAETEKITVDGEEWYIISSDLLEESGLGMPEVIESAGIVLDGNENVQWLGHEDWNHYQGWMGYIGEGDATGTREIATAALSNGSEGKVLRFACDNEKQSGGENAIENLQEICDLYVDHSYIAVATVKVNMPEDYSRAVISWNGENYETKGDELKFVFGGSNQNVVVLENDNQWHTVVSKVYTPDESEYGFGGDQSGVFLNIGVAINSIWMAPGSEILIESVKIYEVSKTEPTATPEATATPEPTATPEATAAPEATAIPTSAPSDDNSSKGCGSFAASTAVCMAVVCLALIPLKKEEEK